MGSGIAEVFSRSGLHVVAVEVDADRLARGRGHLEHSTDRAITGGKLDAGSKSRLLSRIRFSTDLRDLSDVDLVVEAVPERLDLKAQVFGELDRICRPDVVLASNTSSLSVIELAVRTSRPGKVVGMHFFNPAAVMPLVEVVRTVVTEPDVTQDVTMLAGKLGKSPVVIGDRAGFIANALLFGYLNHAVAMYDASYASREDIDEAMRLGCGYPMGPLALLDLIGLDTAYEILDTMYRQSRDRLHAPAPVLKQMVTAGLLGRKTGRGFYTYAGPNSPKIVEAAAAPSRVHAAADGVREVQRVGVVGTGTMAAGIVEVFARSGFDTVVHGRSDERAAAAVETVRTSLQKAVARRKATDEDAAAALRRITPTSSFDEFADCDLIVEAVAEDLSLKRTVFTSLDEVCRPGAILATTTSSLPVIDCAVATQRPGDVVGMHFFNPATRMKLVEVVQTITTDPDVVATTNAVCAKLGKHPVQCPDGAGFIVNALLFPYLNDAVKMLEAHYASVDDIDNAMKVGCGLPMGPFELLDVVGLDVALAIQRTLYDEFHEAGYAPAPLLEHLVTAGRLGRKTGQGFRDYT
jgi:3-hydroxybutyryl-CoA dehydrogenase